ncbi:MAG: PAS domain S-box protein, partial [Natronomonas sp.]
MQSDARIIWVSDDPPTTAELRSRTHRAVTVDPCSDPDTVLDRLESGAYDGIVSAYDLPKQNGIDLLRRVRANHPDVPFVLITDSGSETVARQAINAGVTAYVQADVQPNPYDAAVEQLAETMPKRLEQQRYETILETIDEAVYVLDTDGRIEYVNRRYAEMKGVSREALLGTSIERWADAETLDTARKMAAEIDSGARTVGVLEYEFRTADGEAIPAELRFTSIEFGDGTVGRVGVIRDLSETKQRQQELQRQERIIEASGDAVYALDSAGRFTFVNSTLLEMTGYDEAELLGAHASMLLDRADVRRGEQVIAALLTAEEANEREILEMEIETKDGARIPCETHIALLPFDEEFRGTVGVIRNISDRRERERRLERTETQLSAIFENSPDVITLHRPDGTFLRANCQFVRGTGYDESELDSISVWSLDEQTPTETIGSVWESMEPGDTRRVEVSIRCRNGTALPLEINLARVTIAGEDRFLAIGRDISRRKRQEQQLVALGNVLRHNLRNELTVIQGCADEITRTADAETT